MISESYTHTDKNGIPCQCCACEETLREPAIKIPLSVQENTDIDGPWVMGWSVVYNFYCEKCATKTLVRRRGPKWLRFLMR